MVFLTIMFSISWSKFLFWSDLPSGLNILLYSQFQIEELCLVQELSRALEHERSINYLKIGDTRNTLGWCIIQIATEETVIQCHWSKSWHRFWLDIPNIPQVGYVGGHFSRCESHEMIYLLKSTKLCTVWLGMEEILFLRDSSRALPRQLLCIGSDLIGAGSVTHE